MADIVIINPRFDVSFFGLEYGMPLLGKRAHMPVACLALLAALVPEHHQVTLIDEDVEEIDFDRVCRADLVCLTGMGVQGRRLLEILEVVKSRGAMTVVGGPMATVEPETFEGLADVVFVGEADETWPQFLAEWERGCHQPRYQQRDKTDVTRLPLPRIDLLKLDRYMFANLQISRGCPFTCEFCDIIVTFGRRPRLKTSEQVLAELDAIHRAGRSIAFVVDDNLIGNKKAIKPILRDIIRWQEERAYPLTLSTEASLDLAEDDELMELMGDANFHLVFVGIESPNAESLRETRKHQNVRERAGTMVERVRRIQDKGIDVWCGLVVGFDHDDSSVFNRMPEFLAEARIATALVSILHAIPTTPLYDRLKREGRLNDDDATDRYGTNVVPLGMSREELRDGFVHVMQASYSADSYFQRLDAQFIEGGFKFKVHQLPFWRGRHLKWAKRSFLNWARIAVISARLMRMVPDPDLRVRYRRQLLRVLRARWREPHIVFYYTLKVVMHYHYAEICRTLEEAEGHVPSAARFSSRVKKRGEAEAAA